MNFQRADESIQQIFRPEQRGIDLVYDHAGLGGIASLENSAHFAKKGFLSDYQ